MISQDEFGPLALLSGLLSGYQVSSEILDATYHKNDADNFNEILQKLLKVPSPALRKRAESLRMNLEEKVKKYAKMNELYTTMIRTMENDIADMQIRLNAITNSTLESTHMVYADKKFTRESHAAEDENKMKVKADLERIRAQRKIPDGTEDIDETVMIQMMASIVSKLRLIKQKEDDMREFGSKTESLEIGRAHV